MSEAASAALIDQLRTALREEVVILELSNALGFDLGDVGGASFRPVVRVCKPGKTARSKPVQTVPILVGDAQTQPLSEMLRTIAEILAEEGR